MIDQAQIEQATQRVDAIIAEQGGTMHFWQRSQVNWPALRQVAENRALRAATQLDGMGWPHRQIEHVFPVLMAMFLDGFATRGEVTPCI